MRESATAALSALFMPRRLSSCRSWRERFERDTSSPSATVIRIAPEAARYCRAGEPSPPAPITRKRAAAIRSRPSSPNCGRRVCRLSRSMSSGCIVCLVQRGRKRGARAQCRTPRGVRRRKPYFFCGSSFFSFFFASLLASLACALAAFASSAFFRAATSFLGLPRYFETSTFSPLS